MLHIGHNRAHRRRQYVETRHADSGATAVELAVSAPILMGLLLLLVQAFFWGMGNLAAQAAAAHAAQTTRVAGGTPAAGHAEGNHLLTQLGGRFVDEPAIVVTRGPQTTIVTITGTAHGLSIPISVTVQVPTEPATGATS
jgi:hypothetical protein